jgi:hypothetical protein
MYFKKFWLNGRKLTQVNSVLFKEDKKVATICFDKSDIDDLIFMITHINDRSLMEKLEQCLDYLEKEGK